MRPPLALVVNSRARTVKRRYWPRDPFWQRYLPSELVRVTTSLAELEHAIAAFRDAGVRAIAVLGGDGTLHCAIDAVVREYADGDIPIILALAGGTMNGVPRALGTGAKPEVLLRDALRELAGGTPRLRRRHVLAVADARGRTRHGFSFATGLVYRAFQHYYRTPDPGLVAAIGATLLPARAALFGGPFFRDVGLDATVSNEPLLPEPPHTLVASVFDKPLLWFRPFGSPLEDGKAFHLAATSMRPREIAPRLWSLFRGTCRHPRLWVGPVEEVVVRGAGDVGYLIDGELYACSPPSGFEVRLTAGPEIRFVAPGQLPASD